MFVENCLNLDILIALFKQLIIEIMQICGHLSDLFVTPKKCATKLSPCYI